MYMQHIFVVVAFVRYTIAIDTLSYDFEVLRDSPQTTGVCVCVCVCVCG
jgi:hypothetical protein